MNVCVKSAALAACAHARETTRIQTKCTICVALLLCVACAAVYMHRSISQACMQAKYVCVCVRVCVCVCLCLCVSANITHKRTPPHTYTHTQTQICKTRLCAHLGHHKELYEAKDLVEQRLVSNNSSGTPFDVGPNQARQRRLHPHA